MSNLAKIEGGRGEEIYDKVKSYVNYYINNQFGNLIKYYSYEREDLVHEVYVRLKEKGFFKKYDKQKSKKGYYISVGVRRTLLNIVRRKKAKKRREEKYLYSLEYEYEDDEYGYRQLKDMVESDFDLEDKLFENKVYSIIRNLPNDRDTGKEIYGESPILGECRLTLKTLGLHLIEGFSGVEISKMFESRMVDGHISFSLVYKMKKKLRKEIRSRMSTSPS